MTEPLFPDIRVGLTEHAGKSMAQMALVRRALQKAGEHASAARFTEEALAGDPDRVEEIAARYVRVD